MSKRYEYSGETTEWEDILIQKGIATREGALLSRGLNPDDVSAYYKLNYYTPTL